jgi:MFS family permease
VNRRVVLAVAVDVVAVVAFVAVGRRNHDEATSLSGILGVAAPFLIGLAVGWLVLRAWRAPFDIAYGLGLAVATVALGMLLRNVPWDRGTATAFVIVATVGIGTLLIAWRALATTLTTRYQRAKVSTR